MDAARVAAEIGTRKNRAGVDREIITEKIIERGTN